MLSLDEEGLELECRLPPVAEHVQGQFPAGSVNPYVADALFQAIVVWARQTSGSSEPARLHGERHALPATRVRPQLYRVGLRS